MSTAETVELAIHADTSGVTRALRRARVAARHMTAAMAYVGAISGVISTDLTGETEHATSDWKTDARDTYYTARDALEEPTVTDQPTTDDPGRIAPEAHTTGPTNPDCDQAKHSACSGTAWDDAEDELAVCCCHCHRTTPVGRVRPAPKPDGVTEVTGL